MAVGWQGNSTQLNDLACSLATSLLTTLDGIDWLQNYVSEGGTAALEMAGFSTADATTFTAQVGYLYQIAQIANGQQAVPTEYNFVQAIAALLGPSSAVLPGF